MTFVDAMPLNYYVGLNVKYLDIAVPTYAPSCPAKNANVRKQSEPLRRKPTRYFSHLSFSATVSLCRHRRITESNNRKTRRNSMRYAHVCISSTYNHNMLVGRRNGGSRLSKLTENRRNPLFLQSEDLSWSEFSCDF